MNIANISTDQRPVSLYRIAYRCDYWKRYCSLCYFCGKSICIGRQVIFNLFFSFFVKSLQR